MINFLATITSLCTLAALAVGVFSLVLLQLSAPQQAALMASCLLFSVGPYVLLRALATTKEEAVRREKR